MRQRNKLPNHRKVTSGRGLPGRSLFDKDLHHCKDIGMKTVTKFLSALLPLSFLLTPFLSLANPPKILNAQIQKVVASSTAKGSIKSVFKKSGGYWKGKRAAPKQAAQASSDNIQIELQAPGVAIEAIDIYPCNGYRFSSPTSIHFKMQISGKNEILVAGECKTHECFTLRGNETSVQSIKIDFRENQKVCIKKISLFSTGGESIAPKFK